MLAAIFGKRKASGDAEADAAALANYELGDILGEGSFATVRLATRKSDGERLAIKLISSGTTSAAEAEHELKILSTLGMHRHIVSLVDHFTLSDSSAVVMELADGGEVFERICDKGAYSEADAANVIRQVALALAFMHSVGVVHRDLKPENLLLTRSEDVKVADFGLAAFCGEGHTPLTQVCGTVVYMAPEQIAAGEGGDPYGPEVDIFALGNILFCLLAAYGCFDPHCNRSDEAVMQKSKRHGSPTRRTLASHASASLRVAFKAAPNASAPQPAEYHCSAAAC